MDESGLDPTSDARAPLLRKRAAESSEHPPPALWRLPIEELRSDVQTLLNSIVAHSDYSSLQTFIASLLGLKPEDWKAFNLLRNSATAKALLAQEIPRLFIVIPDDIWRDLAKLHSLPGWGEVQDRTVSLVRGQLLLTPPARKLRRTSQGSTIASARTTSRNTLSSTRNSYGNSMADALSRHSSLRQVQSVSDIDRSGDQHETGVGQDLVERVELSKDPASSAKKLAKAYPCSVRDCRQKAFSRLGDLQNHLNNCHHTLFKDVEAKKMSFDQLEAFIGQMADQQPHKELKVERSDNYPVLQLPNIRIAGPHIHNPNDDHNLPVYKEDLLSGSAEPFAPNTGEYGAGGYWPQVPGTYPSIPGSGSQTINENYPQPSNRFSLPMEYTSNTGLQSPSWPNLQNRVTRSIPSDALSNMHPQSRLPQSHQMSNQTHMQLPRTTQ